MTCFVFDGGGKNILRGGTWGMRGREAGIEGREVGVRGEGSGDWGPPCPPPPISISREIDPEHQHKNTSRVSNKTSEVIKQWDAQNLIILLKI